MNLKNPFIRFAIIHLIPFELLLLISGIFSISMSISHGQFIAALFSPLFVIIPFFILLIPMYLCYRIFLLTQSLWVRTLILYIFWAVTSLLVLGIFLLGVGASSMAYVDGGMTRETLYAQAGEQTGKAFLWSHLLILPWIYISFLMMKRFVPEI